MEQESSRSSRVRIITDMVKVCPAEAIRIGDTIYRVPIRRWYLMVLLTHHLEEVLGFKGQNVLR